MSSLELKTVLGTLARVVTLTVLPLGMCVAPSMVGALGLTGGPRRSVMGTLSQKDRLLPVPPNRLFPMQDVEPNCYL